MDTDTRKYSAVNLSSPWRGICNIPSGALDEPEWLSIVHLYNEFAAGEPGDTTPDQFSFSDQSGVALSSTITSAPVTITGIDATVSFTATGGTIDVNEDGNFQASRDVVNGDEIRVRHTSSASYLTAVNTLVEGGGVSDTFTSQTGPDPSVSEPRGLGRISIRLGLGI